ncbi:DUF6456 domain-containing protein [Polycladidibacter stylochi]|uniref:DUF6456 domain-containing protein n=1 Tax=Polycladidibacter stylochi TaxID=1807766 RepID=UPI00082AD217|nr:DUF6456 domain-containing protein [Pseudovibrio stylochi]
MKAMSVHAMKSCMQSTADHEASSLNDDLVCFLKKLSSLKIVDLQSPVTKQCFLLGLVRHNTKGGLMLTTSGKTLLKKSLSAKGTPAQSANKPAIPPKKHKQSLQKANEKNRAENASPVAKEPQDSPLHWLATRRGKSGEPFISSAQFMAAERLHNDFVYGDMAAYAKLNLTNLSAPSTRNRDLEKIESVSDARERVRKALKFVGPELSGVLIDICCYWKGLRQVEKEHAWPERSAKVILKIALERLANYYGTKSGYYQ